MARLLPLVYFLLCFSVLRVDAQIDQTYHQVIKVDDIPRMLFNIRGDFTLHTWSSTSMMMEAYIKIDKGNVDILKYLIKAGRYDLILNKASETTAISSKRDREGSLKMKNEVCTESVKIDIYIPEDFQLVNGREAERKSSVGAVVAGKN